MHTATQSLIAATTPKLREASFDDYPQIALLQAARGMGVRSREEWRHLWEGNPAYQQLGGKWPIGWVLQAGSKIVGYVGNIPAGYEWKGRRLIAACGHSWVVTPAYGSYSILLLHEYLRQEHAALCISSTAGPTSYKAHLALGAVPVPAGAWDRSSVWITKYTGFVSSWLERKKWPMADVMSYPISAALYARDAFRQNSVRRRGGASGPVEIECCEKFDKRFEAFWQQLRAENAGKLLADRSRLALDWHFRYALRDKRLWIATIREGSSLSAYAIFKLVSNPTDEVKRMAFVDFQSKADKATCFYAVLEWALEKCTSSGIHLLETIGLCPNGIGDVSMLAPYTIRQQAWPYLYKALDRSLVEALSDPQVWCPSLFDGDATV
jgi:hypothetical protein